MLRPCRLVLTLLALPIAAHGQALFLSTSDDAGNALGGLNFTDGDIIAYDADADTATLYFAETQISPDADLDAFHRLPDGSLLLSTRLSGRTLGSLTFSDGDLVRYVPGSNTASVYFLSESSFGVGSDIDAVSVNASGNLVLSTLEDNTLGGLVYTSGDLIAYDTESGLASLLVAETNLFDDGEGDISGVHVLDDGTYLLTFAAASETISGVAFVSGDIVHYDPADDAASLLFSESLFTDANAHAVDAVYRALNSPPAGAGFVFYLSDNNNVGNELGGLTFDDGDVVIYDEDWDTASVFFAEGLITPSSDIDAFHLFPDGSFLLSTIFAGRSLGGLTFDDGDLVRYDPANDVASIYFLSEASFTGPSSADISAVSATPDGKLILSNREANTLGGLSYDDGDLILYDPDTERASLYLAETDLFDDGDGDISSVHLLPDRTLLLSFASATETISGTLFNDGDIVHYDPVTDTAIAVFTELQFTDGSSLHEIDAVYVPPPGDCDFDGDVDPLDHAAATDCLTGPNVAWAPDCGCFDLDHDGDNDLADFARFARGFTG